MSPISGQFWWHSWRGVPTPAGVTLRRSSAVTSPGSCFIWGTTIECRCVMPCIEPGQKHDITVDIGPSGVLYTPGFARTGVFWGRSNASFLPINSMATAHLYCCEAYRLGTASQAWVMSRAFAVACFSQTYPSAIRWNAKSAVLPCLRIYCHS